jgi:hypothetical protein
LGVYVSLHVADVAEQESRGFARVVRLDWDALCSAGLADDAACLFDELLAEAVLFGS